MIISSKVRNNEMSSGVTFEIVDKFANRADIDLNNLNPYAFFNEYNITTSSAELLLVLAMRILFIF